MPRSARRDRPRPKSGSAARKRLLLEEDYFSLMLFGMLNPVLDSMRGLCAASHLERVQNEVCARTVSLGSFSEAQGVFDSELLKGVFLDLVGENQASWGDARLSHLADKFKLVDGTLLTEQDRAVGVTWQGKVKFGDPWQGEPIRVVRVEVDGKVLLLATDLSIEAELIALIYRYRWQIELFFKWLKSILRCRHLMAESPRGSGHPDLQCAHAPSAHRQTGDGTHPDASDGLSGPRIGHRVAEGQKNSQVK